MKPTTEKQKLHVDLPANLLREVDRLAAEETISRAAWLRRLIISVTKEQAPERV